MNKRHVAFQLSQFISKEKKEQSAHFRKSRINNDYEMTVLNHYVENHKKTIFTLKCFSHRLRLTKKKKPKTLKTHINDLFISFDIEFCLDIFYYRKYRSIRIFPHFDSRQ